MDLISWLPVINTPTTSKAPPSVLQANEQCSRDTTLDSRLHRELILSETAKHVSLLLAPSMASVASDNLELLCLLQWMCTVVLCWGERTQHLPKLPAAYSLPETYTLRPIS